ncbi:MAG: hypothetical protein ACLSDQ_11785 [Adlercreutzia equolifaciens]
MGSGHRSAANAIAEALEEAGEAARAAGNDNSLEARSEVRVLDILDFGRIVFDGDKTASMFTGWTRPFYDLTWRYTLTGRLLWGGGTIWARLMYPKFTEYVRRLRRRYRRTITAANVAVSARMIWARASIVCVPTDYEAEGCGPSAPDLFCVANESMARRAPRRCPRPHPHHRHRQPAFSRTYDRAEAREASDCRRTNRWCWRSPGQLPQPYVHFRAAIEEISPSCTRCPRCSW